MQQTNHLKKFLCLAVKFFSSFFEIWNVFHFINCVFVFYFYFQVNGGSLAEQAGLMPGDAVIKINDVDVFNLRHKDAQDIVVRSGNNFVITVQR